VESSISAKLRSSCNAACIQVAAISSNTWRCRCDLVSSAQRKHSCANSRNSLGDAAMARSPRHNHCVGSGKNVAQGSVTVCLEHDLRESKLGHRDFQIRTQRSELGHYLPAPLIFDFPYPSSDYLGGALEFTPTTCSPVSSFVSVTGQTPFLRVVGATVISAPGIHPRARTRSPGAMRQ
jgi:hypothetical protein